jgi:hypothetical protein
VWNEDINEFSERKTGILSGEAAWGTSAITIYHKARMKVTKEGPTPYEEFLIP